MNEEFRIIAQKYIGMTPKDKGFKTWGEMQQQMANEIEDVVKNYHKSESNNGSCIKKCSCGAELHPTYHCNICDNDE